MHRESTGNPEVIKLISLFREYYGTLGYKEINRMPLVSKQDHTIRFTNSTSSVMKPYYTNGKVLENKIMLVQPAMGCQGIQQWTRKREVGCFSSYFLSFGVMCPYANRKELIMDSLRFFSEVLKIDMEYFYIHYTNNHKELRDIMEFLEVNKLHDQYEESYYIHHFGVEGLIGKTACYTIKNSTGMRYIGSVIILEQDGMPVAVEHSFDSTLFLASLKEHGHPVIEMTGILPWNTYYKNILPFETRMALFDLLVVSIALVMEGLNTGSRGRSRNLRCIVKEIGHIVYEYRISTDQLRQIIQDIAAEEEKIRGHLCGDGIEIRNPDSTVKYLFYEIEKYLLNK